MFPLLFVLFISHGSHLECVELGHANVLKRPRRKQTKSGRLRFGPRPDLTKQSTIELPTILKTMNTPQWAHHLFGRRNVVWLSVWLVRHNMSCCYLLNSNAFCKFKHNLLLI